MKKMKKLLLLCSMLFAFNASASGIPEGAIVKTVDNPDVYIVKYNNGKQYKRLVLNPMVFQSYGHLKWENLLTISQSEMDSFQTSDLVRVDGTTDVYQLVPEGDTGGKYLMASLDFADTDSIYTINAVDFSNYVPRGNRDPYSTSEIETGIGRLRISSTMPFVVSSVDDDTPMNHVELNTWFGFDLDDQYSGMYGFGARIIEFGDLEKLNLSVEFPDGEKSYVKNFKISQVDGKWQLTTERSGFAMMAISDYVQDEVRGYDWIYDDTPNIIPDTFQNKEFIIFLYLMAGE